MNNDRGRGKKIKFSKPKGRKIKIPPKPLKKKQNKRGVDKAELEALLTSNKSFSLQRLMHDYNEIKNQTFPLPGISAIPLDNNFYIWHGNIKCMADNIYKGAVLHFEFVFPRNYPLAAPTIYLKNKNLKHQNIIGPEKRICLDMLEKRNGKKGWKSGYTVLSILLQLQSFFFEIDESLYKEEEKKAIKDAIAEMGEFKCPDCKHKGSSNPYPEFANITNLAQIIKPEEYKKLKKEELCCYHRKTTFEETPLGLGISISRVARTGEIKGITPSFDFVSFKSYTKERLRESMEGEKFTHWFPLYFGIKQDKFLSSVTKTISLIAKGNTKSFKPELINKVMPKFFNYIVLNILSEKVHNSSRAIKTLIYIYRILIMLAEKYPEYKQECINNINNFIEKEEYRIKDKTPSLGDLLVMLSVSDIKIEKLLKPYISEQMDRQIFWILNEIPKLEDLINKDTIDDIRGKVCFKCGLVGEQLLLFYYYFMNKIVYDKTVSLSDFAKKLDQNYCNLLDEEIDVHRIEINKILKIDNFNDYYKYMNLQVPSKEELNKLLKQSFENSKTKKYHGNDEARFVPNNSEQIKNYLSRYSKIESLVKDGKLISPEDSIWEKELDKFDIVQKYKYNHINEKLTALNIIRYQRENLKDRLFFLVPKELEIEFDKEKNNIIGNKLNKRKFKKIVEDEFIVEKMNFRDLYLKLYFEEYIRYFPENGNFKELYSLIEILKNEINHLTIIISNTGILKSDYNYIRAVLSKFTKLQYLEIILTEQCNIKFLKNLVKGISNSLKEGAKIEILKIWNNKSYSLYSTKDLNILTILDNLPSLKILDISNLKITINEILRIRNHLYFYKKLSVLDICSCNIDDKMANELADGIMKAKGLEKLYICNNIMVNGLTSIIYNLAFQPSLHVLDISNNNSCNKKEVATSLYKFLKMSQNVEYIIANHIPDLNKNLPHEFFISLGDSNNIKYLDINTNGSGLSIEKLGMAISFNALKGGVLNYVDISNNSLNYYSFTSLIKNMKVSESDHFNWYGFQLDSNINKENPSYYNKTFHCNLETLVFKSNSIECPVNYLDPKNAKLENEFKLLLNNSKKLDTLIFDGYSYNKNFYEWLCDALRTENNIKYLSFRNSSIDGDKCKLLMNSVYEKVEKIEKDDKKKGKEDKKKINKNFKIEILDLSSNSLGFPGIEFLSNILKENKTIKSINIFHNLGNIDCARKLREALLVNDTLEEIDIGYNKIKNNGFKEIINGLMNNKNSKLTKLYAKYNFIKNDMLLETINKTKTDPKFETILFGNNSITEDFLMKYSKESIKDVKFKTDIFEVLYYLQPERLERTVWINCGNSASKENIYKELKAKEKMVEENEHSKIGIPLYIRKIRGRKIGKKKDQTGIDAFIEFIMPNSSNRILKLSGTYQFNLDNVKKKIYKAGSKPDFILVKKRCKC